MSKKLYIKTYGCQMNVYDSLKMQELLTPFGFEATGTPDDADMFILNTCHIREKASEKMYSELGKIKLIKDTRKKTGLVTIITVAGCVAQAEGEEIFRRAPYVDIIVGPQSYHTLPDLIAKLARAQKHLIELDFIDFRLIFESRLGRGPQLEKINFTHSVDWDFPPRWEITVTSWEIYYFIINIITLIKSMFSTLTYYIV